MHARNAEMRGWARGQGGDADTKETTDRETVPCAGPSFPGLSARHQSGWSGQIASRALFPPRGTVPWEWGPGVDRGRTLAGVALGEGHLEAAAAHRPQAVRHLREPGSKGSAHTTNTPIPQTVGPPRRLLMRSTAAETSAKCLVGDGIPVLLLLPVFDNEFL